MSMSNPDFREMIQRSWNVVDNVDALKAALARGEESVPVLDVALLRGMDYADTTTLICLVDGITITSKRTLGVD